MPVDQKDTDETQEQENESIKGPKKPGMVGNFLNKVKNIFDELAD
jgi:hypothetical protein